MTRDFTAFSDYVKSIAWSTYNMRLASWDAFYAAWGAAYADEQKLLPFLAYDHYNYAVNNGIVFG